MALALPIPLLVAVVSLLCVVLLVGSAALRRKTCPDCGTRAIRLVDFIRATVLRDGKRAPDSWTLWECAACNARFREHQGVWSPPQEEDAKYFDEGHRA